MLVLYHTRAIMIDVSIDFCFDVVCFAKILMRQYGSRYRGNAVLSKALPLKLARQLVAQRVLELLYLDINRITLLRAHCCIVMSVLNCHGGLQGIICIWCKGFYHFSWLVTVYDFEFEFFLGHCTGKTEDAIVFSMFPCILLTNG